jgi:HSP20 family protein
MALIPKDFLTSPLSNGHSLTSFRNEYNKMYRDFFKMWVPALEEGHPAINLSENDDHLIATIELPGVEQKDIKLTIDSDILSVTGEKKKQQDIKDHNWHIMERRFGSFHRSITLPYAPKEDEFEAFFLNGVLTILIKKRPDIETHKHEIPIKST